jgi:phosphohistidine phosphatase
LAARRWLVLLRHGEAEPVASRPDLGRQLTHRGLVQARMAAGRIATLDPPPSLLLTSSAPRAAATAECAAEALGLAASARLSIDALYLASPSTLHDALLRYGGQARCILLVGHNPGLSELGAQLDPEREGAALGTGEWWRIALEDFR